MSPRENDPHDLQAHVEEGRDGRSPHSGALQPLLQKSVAPSSGDTYVHSAFLVDAHERGFFTVSSREQGRRYQVKRAASCLLLPEPGDKVLVSGDAVGGLYIIAVLEQRHHGRSTVHVDGLLTVSADEVALQATSRLALETNAFSLKASSGAVEATDWSVTSHYHAVTSAELDVAAMMSKYTGTQRESFYQSVTETTRQSTRYVTGTDTVKAINLDYAADFIARLSGDTTMINGETVVKADGKQILVG